MLQKVNFDDQIFEPDRSHLLRIGYYIDLVRRRWPCFVIPFMAIALAGATIVYLWPPTYLSQGKILVQSQQIASELVRPTVTNAAQERVQVIEQRTTTRDNLLAIMDKFQLFPEERKWMSATQVVDLMKKSTKIALVLQPLSFAKLYSPNPNPTIVFTVGFEHSDPQIATQVANELVSGILSEDLRDRTSRASDTTKFLAREVQKLQAESAAIDAKIEQAKVVQARPPANSPDQPAVQLAQLKSELAQKSALYSDRHPAMQALKRQVAAMEQAAALHVSQAGAEGVPMGLDVLEAQQAAVEKSLEAASAKLAAARQGEALEREQQSEKLEVIEQPTLPQEPIRPDRRKIAVLSFLLALIAGGSLAFLIEVTDVSIRRSSEVLGLIDSVLVVSIPYITTNAELRRRKVRSWLIVFGLIAVTVLAIVVAYPFLPPLDLIIAKAQLHIFQ
jgi:uncharacterized protein involved in exopolysaccharide biosynthesis